MHIQDSELDVALAENRLAGIPHSLSSQPQDACTHTIIYICILSNMKILEIMAV